MSAGNSYRCALAQEWEAKLPDAKRALWAKIAERLPAPSDYGLELYFLGKIAAGATLEELEMFIPRRFERRDPRALAAGEAA